MISRMKSTPYRIEGDKDPNDLQDLFDSMMEKEECERSFLKKTILQVKSIFNNPLTRLKHIALEKKFQRQYLEEIARAADCEGFREFEEKLKPSAKDFDKSNPERMFNYIYNLLVIDQLDSSMRETGIKMPEKIRALDIGCGRNWGYAELLYGFLQNYDSSNPREVTLTGIDALATKKDIKKFNKRVENENIIQERGDVLKMKDSSDYDFILMHNMLSSPKHFKLFGLEPSNLYDIIEKCCQLLRPNGIQVTIGYQSAGEYWRVAEHIPLDKRIAEFNYAVDLGNEKLNYEFTPGIGRKYRSGICLSKGQQSKI